MIWFQVIILPLLIILLFRNIQALLRGAKPRFPRMITLVVWILALLAVVQPEWTTRVAVSLGIGRGADLVLYILVFAFLGACFHFYNRTCQLESHLSELARYLAIQDALQRWPKFVMGARHGQGESGATEEKRHDG